MGCGQCFGWTGHTDEKGKGKEIQSSSLSFRSYLPDTGCRETTVSSWGIYESKDAAAQTDCNGPLQHTTLANKEDFSQQRHANPAHLQLHSPAPVCSQESPWWQRQMSYFHAVGSSQSDFLKRKVGSCWSVPEHSRAFSSHPCRAATSLWQPLKPEGCGEGREGQHVVPHCLLANPAGRGPVGFLFWKAGKGGRDRNPGEVPALLEIIPFIMMHLLVNSVY